MIRFGAHAFVFIGAWTPEDGDATIRAAAEMGFDFLEIPLLDPSSFDAARHRATLEDVGLGATCSLVLPKHAHAPSEPDRARTFLFHALDQVEAVGADTLCGCLGYSLGTLTGSPPSRDERAIVEDLLGHLAEEAQSRGIAIALEAVNRYETYLYNTIGDVRDSARNVGSSNLGVHGDTYHMNIEEAGFERALRDVGQDLRYLHMSESHRGLVGTGTVDWDGVWRGLAAIGYDGPLVLESFAAINPDLAAATCLWRPPAEPPEVLAREGLAFLKQGAARVGLLKG